MDKALKQRLVGASVLIILAVIVLPMLLGGRSDTLQQESRQIELPSKPDELKFEKRRFPVGITRQPTATDVQTTRIENNKSGNAPLKPEGSVSKTDNAGDSTGAEHPRKQPDSAVPEPPAVTSITLSSGRAENVDLAQAVKGSQNTPRYLVQVASFSSEKNANTLASRLRVDKLPVMMDVVDRAAGRLHRVRVGPYIERSVADAIVADLRLKMKDLSPRVLDLRPGDSAPVSAPSDPLVRWVVQVGSFSSSKSAEAVVAELRLAGLAAFSEKVTAANSTAYKVRIGPEIDRDKATALARKVKAEHQLDGFVLTLE